MTIPDRPNPGRGDDKNDRPFDGVTRLLIRDNALDNGSTPSSPPVWLSPDILVTPPGGPPGGDPVVGLENTVTVTVRNGGGIQALGVYVDAFACDPTTGWTPATAAPLGGAYVDVAPYSLATVDMPWTPPPGPTHRCLMARASLLIPADTYANPAVFDVVGDRHVAQRNVNLVALLERATTITFGFMIVNGQAQAGEFLLAANHVEPTPNNIRMLEGGLGCILAQFGRTPISSFELTVGGRLEPGRYGEGERRMGVLDKPLRELAPDAAPAAAELRLWLEPGEVRQGFLTVARNPATRPGDLHIMQVAQSDARTGRVTGGLWLVLRH